MAEEKKKIKKTEKPEAASKTKKKKVEHPIEAKPAEKLEEKHAEIKVEHKEVKHKVKKAPKEISGRFYGTGRRKRATARVYISKGNGKIVVNNKTAKEYFCDRPVLMALFIKPFVLTNTFGQYDVIAKLIGGGVAAQADALRLGIARALLLSEAGLKKVLRTSDMLRRDPREKERKKYGLKRARRAFQYTKR
ncbi:MAG: small subunit ribosomal protein S9 [Candidatus Saganbacteria bacterium]|uniref:Small ribosomal subunit protein uS9 n=1 Tax=Candidatus Saganbacteria bacterium TaxID=2575572 RepID=A0A833L139_UNCSA|nr:MAG: small subunit ribosomal protein S9 [Candidatus Saganbacteria bacterium]